jgi:hypothetical protein
MNKKLRRFTKADDSKLRALWASHLSEHLVAKQMGYSRWVIRRRAMKLGLPSSRRELWDKESA